MNFVFPNKPLRIYNPESFLSSVNPKGWWVQPKWNGHRALPFCDKKGEIIIYNRLGKLLTRGGNQFKWLSVLDIPRPWLLDGELTPDMRLIVWDMAIQGGKMVFRTEYKERFKGLEKLIPKKLKKNDTSIELVENLDISKYQRLSLKRADPCLEGFIFKNPKATDLWGPFTTCEVPSQVKYRFKE